MYMIFFTLKFVQDLITAKPLKSINFYSILKNVLKVAYLGNISIVEDVEVCFLHSFLKYIKIKVFLTLAQWIFQGIQSNDNEAIRELFLPRPFPASIESMHSYLLSEVCFPNSSILSGLQKSTTLYYKRINERKVSFIKYYFKILAYHQ